MDGGQDANESNSEASTSENPLKRFERSVGGLESVFVVWGPLGTEYFEKVLDFARSNKYAEIGKKDKLNIILHSKGGNPHLTYKSALALRSSVKEVTVYVPRFAKSGATLLCLGVQEVVLALGADLGPLDIQIEDPQNSGDIVSALEITGALKAVAEFLYSEFGVLLHELLRIGVKRSELLSLAMRFMELMGRPLFEQAQITNFNACIRALNVTRVYGKKLLKRSGIINEERLQDEIVRTLVEEYPSHSFVICLDEANELGLLHVRETNLHEYEGLEVLYKYIKHRLENVKKIDRFYGFLSDLRD